MIGAAPAIRAPWIAIEPDAAAADHDDARARLDAGRVDDRAHAGQHAAGDQRGAVERHVLRDRDRLRLRRPRHARRRRRCAGRGRSACRRRRAAGVSRSSGNTSSQNTGAPSAQAGQKPQLRISVATTWSPTFRRVDAGADRLDHARRLVAVDRRQLAAPGAVDIEDVAVADRAGGDPDQDLAGAGLGEFDRLDGQRRAEGAADGGSGFHGSKSRRNGRRLGEAAKSRARGETSSAVLRRGRRFLWARRTCA